MRNKVFCLVLLCLLGLSAPAYQKDPASSPWTPDKTLANKLDSSADVDDFQIRLPASYLPKVQPGIPGSLITAWVGAGRSDGTKPYILVTIQAVQGEDVSKITPEMALKVFLQPLEKKWKNWTGTAPEKGGINDLPFVRVRWRGVNPTTGQVTHGFSYVTVKSGKVVQISSQDVEPHHKEGLELAETAALTFKRRF
jgi:hypothetical protein